MTRLRFLTSRSSSKVMQHGEPSLFICFFALFFPHSFFLFLPSLFCVHPIQSDVLSRVHMKEQSSTGSLGQKRHNHTMTHPSISSTPISSALFVSLSFCQPSFQFFLLPSPLVLSMDSPVFRVSGFPPAFCFPSFSAFSLSIFFFFQSLCLSISLTHSQFVNALFACPSSFLPLVTRLLVLRSAARMTARCTT